MTRKLKFVENSLSSVSRPLRIPESGEITPLLSLRKAEFTIPPPFTFGVSGLVTIVATQSLQFGVVFANTLSYFLFFVVVSLATIIVVVFLFEFFLKWPFSRFLGSVTSQIEISKFRISRIFRSSRFVQSSK